MKAIRFDEFGPPEVLRLDEVPTPTPGADEVLIDIEAASVTPGDGKLRAGLLRDVFPVELPCIPGRDGAGVVAAVGPLVRGVSVGDAVCFVAERTRQGSYAQCIVRDAAAIARLPSGLSFAEGAALVHAGTCAWIGLVRYAQLQRGEHVLVQGGAGAIGGMAVQLARHLGARVTATCRASNVDYVRGLGAETVIAYDREDFSERLRGMDVVFDLVGGEVHRASYRVLRRGGRLVWLLAAPIAECPSGFEVQTLRALIEDDAQSLSAVVDLAGQGKLRPQVSHVMPLEKAARAHRLLEQPGNRRGRLVLDIRGRAATSPDRETR